MAVTGQVFTNSAAGTGAVAFPPPGALPIHTPDYVNRALLVPCNRKRTASCDAVNDWLWAHWIEIDRRNLVRCLCCKAERSRFELSGDFEESLSRPKRR